MTVKHAFYLECDGCGRKSGNYLADITMFKRLSEKRWWEVVLRHPPGRRDTKQYCPRCAPKAVKTFAEVCGLVSQENTRLVGR